MTAAAPAVRSGALAVQNAAGFAITLAAIALATAAFDAMGAKVAWITGQTIVVDGGQMLA